MFKIKNTKTLKKMLSLIMLLVTLFSTVQPVLAASGTAKFVAGQFGSYMFTTDNKDSDYGLIIRKIINRTTNEAKTVFCAQHGLDIKTGAIHSGTYYTPTDEKTKYVCKIAYFGWYEKYGDYVVDGGITTTAKKDYAYTQQFIWEYLGQSNATFINATYQNEYVAYKNDITNKINNMQRKPSFSNSTITLDIGQTTTLTDTNGVLADYCSIDKTINGIRLVHNKGENTMTLTVDEGCTLENYQITEEMMKQWGLIKEQTRDNDTTIHITFPGDVQDQLYSLNYNDPVAMSLNLQINLFGKLELSKLNENGDLINGAVFRVQGENYSKDITVENGKITIDKLKKGTYTINELSAPTGYLLNTETYNVEIKANQTTTQAIVNKKPTGTFTLVKKNEDSTKALEGTKYRIWNGNGYNKEFTTDKDGKITVEGLELGTYQYKEIQATTGYLLDTNTYSFELKYKDQNTSVIYANAQRTNKEPTGTFTLVKKNEDGTKVLEGTKYRIWNSNGYDKEFTTDSQGKIIVSGLKMGTYNYKEIQATYGYLLDTNTYLFELKYKDQNTNVIYASAEKTNKEPTGTFTLVKKNADKTATLEGTKYRIWSNNGYDKEFTTNSEGKIVVTGLKMGTYNYKEIQATNGYLLDTNTYSFELKYKDQNTSIIYANAERTNKEPTGNITIIKRDSETGSTPQGDATLENAKYEVYANEDIYNVAKTKKYYSKCDLVVTRTMNKNGTTEDVTGLPLGRYKVKECHSSLGYLIDTNEYIVELKYKDQDTKVISETTTSNEVVKKMQVHIFKSGIKEQSGVVQGVEGVEFTIKLNSDVEEAYSKGYTYAEVWNGIDEYGNKITVNAERVAEAQKIAPTHETIVTDENGDGYTEKLPYGKYIGKETKGLKDYYIADDFYFTISQDTTEIEEIAKKVKHIVINNEQMESYVKLVKKDAKTDKIVTLSSATFKIKATADIYDRGNGKIIYKKGETITQKIGSTIYDTFTTNTDNIVVPNNSYNTENDDKGTVVTPLTLPVGNYEVFEVQIPKGFLQSERIVFKIEGIRDYDKDDQGDYIKTIEIKNEQPTCTIIIDKEILVRENANTSLIDTSDLSGIEFTLVAKKNIIDMADGSIIYEKGSEIKKAKLTKEGTLEIIGLPVGCYELYESKTLDGLVLNEKRYEVKFTQKDTVTKVYDEKLEIKNETTLVEFSKKSITGEYELVGAKLTVLDENNNVIDTWISTTETHKIEGLTAGKTYTLREELSPDGFVKATDIQFTVKNTNEIQKVEMTDKIVEIVKTDLVTGEEIEGAELQVIDEDGNIIDSWTSTKELHKVSGLEENKNYKLIEITSPYGFEIAEEIEFTVTSDKQTQRIEMKDMPILQTIKLVKKDIETNETIKEKFTFGIYEDEQCTKLIKKVDSDKKEGTSTFKDLRYGTFFIKEEESPKGYVLSDKIIKVEINDKGVFIDETKVEGENSVYTFDFYNTPIDTPNTGDNRNLTLWATLLGLSVAALTGIGVHEYKKKKVNKK